MIFTIFGTDHYLVLEKLKELKNGFVQKRDKTGLNVVKLTGENLDINQFCQEALMTPFLGDKKMVVVTGGMANKKINKEIVNFLENNHQRIDNIICFVDLIDPEKYKTIKNNKLNIPGELFKYLTKQEYVWEFNPLKGRDLENWIKKYTDNKNIKIELSAIKELIIRIGNDLFQITSELDKLSAFKDGLIDTSDIKAITGTNFDDNIFGLVDAIGNKDKKNSLKLITNQINYGTHPLMIISMVARQFKLILKAKSDNVSVIKLKIHPFVFGKIKKQAQNFTTTQLIKINNEILTIEEQLKSGEKNPELLLDLFITKNC